MIINNDSHFDNLSVLVIDDARIKRAQICEILRAADRGVTGVEAANGINGLKLLLSLRRQSDIVACYGGEEFILLLPKTAGAVLLPT